MQTNQRKNEEKMNAVQLQDTLKNGAENMQGVEIQEVGQRLSEIVRDLPPEKKASSQAAAKKTHRLTAQQLKEKLLANLPSEKKMKAGISSKINEEISDLQSKAKWMVYLDSKVNYFELNNILTKIRELTDTLASLAKATFEMIKSLWLRFVHGITV